MRAIVQRVRSASVAVDGRVVGAIDHGLLVFVGVTHGDGPADRDYIAAKVRELRIFPDESGRMNRSVVESSGSLLVVSQFTLYADTRKGRRPSLDAAAPPALAEALYLDLVRTLRDSGLRVETGIFQADMQVSLVNDGPVTIWLDTETL
jgi:D-tyrosyl-tRNA(Tyr) deacylase